MFRALTYDKMLNLTTQIKLYWRWSVQFFVLLIFRDQIDCVTNKETKVNGIDIKNNEILKSIYKRCRLNALTSNSVHSRCAVFTVIMKSDS